MNCLFAGNTATDGGGAIYQNVYSGSYTDNRSIITNCTLAGNNAPSGSAIAISTKSNTPSSIDNAIAMINSILRGSGDRIWDSGHANNSMTVQYSYVEGGWPGVGNISAIPLFQDANGPDNIPNNEDDDYRLTLHSSGIDAGDNTAVPVDDLDLDGDGNTTEPIPIDANGRDRFADYLLRVDIGNGTAPIVDMGAYEYSICGDGVINVLAGEACDYGGESAACDADCTIAICGDGTINVTAGETCDDGYNDACGSCNVDCMGAGTGSLCGDRVICDETEACDDGGQSAGCDVDCTIPDCGDRIVNVLAGESCDDGNTKPADGCSSTCQVESGYTCSASNPSFCDDINECTLGTHNCRANESCNNNPGGFICVCFTGYAGCSTARGWNCNRH